jgi:hypothetical protein
LYCLSTWGRCQYDELLDYRGGTMMAVVVILSNPAHSYKAQLLLSLPVRHSTIPG